MRHCSKTALSVCLVLAATVASSALADEYVIRNTETGLVLDIPGGVSTSDVDVWQFESNSSRAQAFEISTLNGPSLIVPKTGTGLALEAQSPLELQGQASATGSGSPSPSVRQNAVVDLGTLESNTPLAQIAARERRKLQQWTFIPVEGEAGTYLIRNVAYGDGKVLAAMSDGPRTLVRLVNSDARSRTKWKLDRLNQNAPTDLRLQTIRYKKGKVEGALSWSDRSDTETRYEVRLFGEGISAPETQVLPMDSNGLNFSFEVGESAADQRQCLTVAAQRDHYKTFEGVSTSACGRAYKRKVGPCGVWTADVEIVTGSGVMGSAGIEEPFTGCIVTGRKEIRIREDIRWWFDRQLKSETFGERPPPFDTFYDCKPGENVGRVFTEMKVDGKTVARSATIQDVANCR